MLLFVVLLQLVVVVKVLVALLTVVVSGRGDPVLLQLVERRKVFVTPVAEIVRVGVLFVLLEGAVVRKEAFAPLTVSHSRACGKRREERER